MKVIDIADEVHRTLDFPTDLSVSAIGYWFRQNIGELNNRIYTTFTIDDISSEITPELTHDQKDIFKKMYMVHYYDKAIRDNLGASGTETIIEVQSDGGRVKRVNRTEVAKTYMQARKETVADLEKMINGYKSSSGTARQVAGDDTLSDSGYESRDYRRV